MVEKIAKIISLRKCELINAVMRLDEIINIRILLSTAGIKERWKHYLSVNT